MAGAIEDLILGSDKQKGLHNKTDSTKAFILAIGPNKFVPVLMKNNDSGELIRSIVTRLPELKGEFYYNVSLGGQVVGSVSTDTSTFNSVTKSIPWGGQLNLSTSKDKSRMKRPHEKEMLLLKSNGEGYRQTTAKVLLKNVDKTKSMLTEVLGSAAGVSITQTICPFCKCAIKTTANASSSNLVKHFHRTHLKSKDTSKDSRGKILKIIVKLRQRRKK